MRTQDDVESSLAFTAPHSFFLPAFIPTIPTAPSTAIPPTMVVHVSVSVAKTIENNVPKIGSVQYTTLATAGDTRG